MNIIEIKNKKELKKLYISRTFSAIIYEENIDADINELKDLIKNDTVYIMKSSYVNKVLKLNRCKGLLFKDNEILFMFINDNELASDYYCRWLDDMINGFAIETDYNPFYNMHIIIREIKWFFYKLFHKKEILENKEEEKK